MVKVLQRISDDFDDCTNPKKILMSMKDWDKMVDEENLTSGFCTKHKLFLGHDNMWCFKCKSEEFTVVRQLPILEIFDTPYEVSGKVNEVKII